MRKRVEYQCHKCKKIRMEIVPPAINIKSIFPDSGNLEFIDVHACINDELIATLLYIDRNFTVRSQTEIQSLDDLKETQSKEDNIAIPQPAKSGMPKVSIVPTSDFGNFNLKGLIIRDKLRQTKYVLNENSE